MNTVLVVITLLAFVGGESDFGSPSRCRQNSSDTKFISNGYEGVLVSIGEEIAEDYSLITGLQQLLTRTSESLFHATRRTAYIRQVNVLIPRSWSNPPSEMKNITKLASIDYSRMKGDIKIKHRSPTSEDEKVFWEPGDVKVLINSPYVIKPTPCGYSGRYVRITPDFIRFGMHEKATEVYGQPEKVMVRQWAKLRWGVYDEVPVDGLASNFYRHSDLKINPVACSRTIPGQGIDVDGVTRDCSSNEALDDAKCIFEPSKTVASGKTFASIMYRTDRSYIQHFCDDAESRKLEERQHNAEAPTVHNLHCQGKSIWEVMRDHPDFAQGTNPALSTEFEVPPTEITLLLQNPVRRIVLVLDTSTSMERHGRLRSLRQAASQFIDTVPEKSWIGIVGFAVRARVLSPLQEIISEEDRLTLKARLPNNTLSGTSIGGGIQQGLRLLQQAGSGPQFGSNGTMLLLSDGKEHNRPKINDMIDQIMAAGVKINTIALGNQVSEDLEKLAEITGGASYFASSGNFADDSELRAAFLAMNENEEDDSVVVSSVSITILPNSTATHDFDIDATIGNKARITIIYSDPVPPEVGLTDPQNITVWETYTNNSESIVRFMWDEDFSTKVIRYNAEMQAGLWQVILKNRREHATITADVTIFSQPAEDKEGLTLSPALLCRQINFTGSENIVVYAHLSLGEFAVLDAAVQATVTRPLTSVSVTYDTSTLFLKDDGRGADVVANDGVYSGYFTSFTLQGRYNVKVNASGTRMTRIHPQYILGIGRLREPPVTINIENYNATSTTKAEGKSRKRRAIAFGFLPYFSRGSNQQKEFIVEDLQADVCPTGYTQFQDNCYKHVKRRSDVKEAAEFCASENGYLARANSDQEYHFLLSQVAKDEAWIGGADKSVTTGGISQHQRVKRHTRDDDLSALADAFSTGALDEEMRMAVESFEPDWDGLSRKEINGIVRKLGISSESEIESFKQNKLRSMMWPYPTASSYTRRWKRTSDELSDNGALGQQYQTTISTTTLLHQNITLALAKKEPEKIEFNVSRMGSQECSWISNFKLIDTAGAGCQGDRAFLCERAKIDLVPPSRITDFRLMEHQSDSDIVIFTWTAPGDDGTIGTATRYEIRALHTSKARILENNFELGQEVTSEDIIQGTLSTPKLSGEEEKLTVNRSQISGCPNHVAVAVIFIIPRRILDPKQSIATERKGLMQLLLNLTDVLEMSEYELQVSIVIFENTKGHIILQDSINKAEVIRSLTNEEDTFESNLTSIVEELSGAGRASYPKLAIAILSNEDVEVVTLFKKWQHLINTVVVGVTVSDAGILTSAVSEPVCENAILVENWRDITSSVPKIVRQICRARTDEYQAWGILAIDDEGLRGPTSNIISSVIVNRAEPVECPVEKATTLPMVAEGSSSIVGLAVGIPLAIIGAIIGAVMLFGQVRKYKRKRELEKQRLAEDAGGNESAARAPNDRWAVPRSNRTAPTSQPPV